MNRARVPRVQLFGIVIASLALAGCSQLSPPKPDAPSLPPAPTPLSSSTVSAAPTLGPPVVAPAACTRDNLVTTYVETDNSAGHFHGVINFSNRLSTPCSMDGYPSVWFNSPEAESVIGAQASFDPVKPPSLVILQPGGILQAALTITNAGTIDCNHTNAIALLVAPPLDHPVDLVDNSDTQHVTIHSTPACVEHKAALLSVGAVTVAPH